MQNITLRVSEDMVESLDKEADEHEVSRSEYVRDIFASRDDESALVDEYERKIDEYERKMDELQTQVERLEREKLLILEEREEKQELVEFVEQERSLREKEAEERRRQRQAGIMTRSKWWIFGMD